MLYENSLLIAFFGMFLAAIVLHALSGTAEFNAERMAHGEAPMSTLQFATSAHFWFQSFQNWQSEFLAVAAIVLFTVVLRQTRLTGVEAGRRSPRPDWELSGLSPRRDSRAGQGCPRSHEPKRPGARSSPDQRLVTCSSNQLSCPDPRSWMDHRSASVFRIRRRIRRVSASSPTDTWDTRFVS